MFSVLGASGSALAASATGKLPYATLTNVPQAAPSTTRLPARANVNSIAVLPKQTLPSSFVSSSAVSSSPLESNLTVAYAMSAGSTSSEIALRSILTAQQQQDLKEKQRLAAEELLAEGGEPDTSATSYLDPAPLLASLTLRNVGDISSLKFLSDRLMVTANGSGEVSMIEITQATSGGSAFMRRTTSQQQAGIGMRSLHTFSQLHSSASTALAVQLSSSTPLVASASEDGSFALLAPFTRQTLFTAPFAHTGGLHAIEFGGVNSLHTAGQGGRISSWDLRAPLTSSTSSLHASATTAGGAFSFASASASTSPLKPAAIFEDVHAVSITSLAVHPTRPFNLAVGSSNGTVSLFDLRRASRAPLCSIQAQRSAVYDVSFVPWAPSSVLVAGEDGSVCVFDFGASADFHSEVRFSMEEAQTRMKPSKLYQHNSAVNAVAIERDSRTIVAGCDGHAIVVMNNVL